MDATHERRAFPLALMAMATVAAAAGCGSSGSKPASQATHAAPTQPTLTKAVATTHPVAPPQKFTSQKYGFRVTLTKASSEADAIVAWNGRKLQGLDSAAFANFTDPATDRTLAVAAARVAPGMGLAEWRAAMVRATPSICPVSSSVEQTTLGGEPALAWTTKCGDGYNVNKLAIENVSDQDVFVQAGDVVKGGQQDRTLAVDMIVPPKSGKVPIESFCVEQGRWGYRTKQFVGGGSHSSSKLRRHLKESVARSLKEGQGHRSDQGAVWAEVGHHMRSHLDSFTLADMAVRAKGSAVPIAPLA